LTLPLEIAASADEAARRVGSLVAERLQSGGGAAFSLALSKVPQVLLEELAALPWDDVDVYLVDERVAPAGHPDRNVTALLAALPPDVVHPMPVEHPDLEGAANRYAAELPEHLDLVHLGLGSDGHTASLVAGDPVLDVRDRLVAVTQGYLGRRRMTLTYPALEAAREIVWLVTGEEKADALVRLLARDPSIPAGRIANPRQLVVADAAAASP